jgi:hypothetical protein
MFPSFQVRIGNMDGVIVAYHNTARLFGFQYISLDEMDTCLFGGKGRGDHVFQKCVGLLEQVADEIIRVFPEQVRSIILTLDSYVFSDLTNLVAISFKVHPMHVRNGRTFSFICLGRAIRMGHGKGAVPYCPARSRCNELSRRDTSERFSGCIRY